MNRLRNFSASLNTVFLWYFRIHCNISTSYSEAVTKDDLVDLITTNIYNIV